MISNTKESVWLYLIPDDTFEIIFDKLSLKDVFNCTKVSKKLKNRVDEYLNETLRDIRISLGGKVRPQNVYKITLKYPKIKIFYNASPYIRDYYLKFLKNVYCLNLTRCNSIKNLNLSQKVNCNVKKNNIFLFNTAISDISCLNNINTLILSHTMISDVSSLSNVENIDLSNTLVEDISNLHNARYLDLGNTMVRDLNFLPPKIKVLNLSDTLVKNIKNVPKSLERLFLNHTGIKDVTALKNLKEIDLSYTCVEDVSCLKDVDILNLDSCLCIKKYGKLNNRKLILKDNIIHDINDIITDKVKILDISNTEVGDINSLTNLEELNISWCLNITEVNSLHNLKKLNISWCMNITNIYNLTNLETLIAKETPDIDLSNVKNVIN